MRRLKAMNGNTICVKVPQLNVSYVEGGVITDTREVDIFEVVDSDFQGNGLELRPGDKIIVASTGDQFQLDGQTYYLFKNQHVTAKL